MSIEYCGSKISWILPSGRVHWGRSATNELPCLVSRLESQDSRITLYSILYTLGRLSSYQHIKKICEKIITPPFHFGHLPTQVPKSPYQTSLSQKSPKDTSFLV